MHDNDALISEVERICYQMVQNARRLNGRDARYVYRAALAFRQSVNDAVGLEMQREGGGELNKVDSARLWLEQYLEEYASEVEVLQILNDGLEAGHKKHTLTDAAKRLGVVKRRNRAAGRGRNANWTWRLPEQIDNC